MCLQDLVAPTFWSYLVLPRSRQATGILYSLVNGKKRNAYVKILSVHQLIGTGQKVDERCHDQHALALLRQLPRLVHIHLLSHRWRMATPLPVLVYLTSRSEYLSPIEGLTGLVVDADNFTGAMLVLDRYAHSLHRLSIHSIDGEKPITVHCEEDCEINNYPALVYLDIGIVRDDGEAWLDFALQQRSSFPALAKVAIRPPRKNGVPVTESWTRWLHYDVPLDARCIPRLGDVVGESGAFSDRPLRELAFGFGSSEDPMDLNRFISHLDRWDEVGMSETIQSVVVVEGTYKRENNEVWDRCLVELVNRRRMPALKKVVWVAARKPSQTHDGLSWSGSVPISSTLPPG